MASLSFVGVEKALPDRVHVYALNGVRKTLEGVGRVQMVMDLVERFLAQLAASCGGAPSPSPDGAWR
jgi:hypothetical protein